MINQYSFPNIPISNKFYYGQETILYYDLKPSFWVEETSLQQAAFHYRGCWIETILPAVGHSQLITLKLDSFTVKFYPN
jgi:hypothetical protein